MEINCAAGKLAIRSHFKEWERAKQLDYGNGAVWEGGEGVSVSEWGEEAGVAMRGGWGLRHQSGAERRGAGAGGGPLPPARGADWGPGTCIQKAHGRGGPRNC